MAPESSVQKTDSRLLCCDGSAKGEFFQFALGSFTVAMSLQLLIRYEVSSCFSSFSHSIEDIYNKYLYIR
jgi:hypothetical protein